MSISTYMKFCLTSPIGGYYGGKGGGGRDIFGSTGDFATAPGLCPLFGDAIGIWAAMNAQAARERGATALDYVELGPGQGDLMRSVVRAVRRVAPDLGLSVIAVERSEALGEAQAAVAAEAGASYRRYTTLDEYGGTRGDADGPVLLLAHEFFDALGVHGFEYREGSWREKLISVDPEHPDVFQFVLSPKETAAAEAIASLVDVASPTDGDSLEVSYDAQAIARTAAGLVGHYGGAGLVMDYGSDETPRTSFRAIAAHEFRDPLEVAPGTADLTADVDFGALRRAMESVDGVRTTPTVGQAPFLASLGIAERAEQVVSKMTDRKAALDLVSSYKRIMGPTSMGGMGEIYKAMQFYREKDGVVVPAPGGAEGSE
jgi:NADH dehydrogenase [ubiquinone] 1 alpha subcomplex assembly factor 7